MRPSRPVLVVDDDLEARTLLADLLRRRGFEVDVASDGVEAIEVLERAAPPGALIADLWMPGIVGAELLEYVRARRELADVPIAIVSGSPRGAPRGYKVFTKPVDAEALVAFLQASARSGLNL
jgi:CheY-like chemotaxis protein